MTFDQKDLRFIELLSQHKGYVTAISLAEKFGISQKTVYRLIDRINEKSQSKNLIKSRIGKGFKLNYEEYLLETIDSHVKMKPSISPTERRNMIFLKLLFKSPHKLYVVDLFNEFHMSDSSIAKDIRSIYEMVKKENLALNKKDNKLWIEGEESAIRQSINSIISGYERLSLEKTHLVTKFLNKYDQEFIKEKITELEKGLNFQLTYPYNVNFYLHLCILLARFRDGSIQSKQVTNLEIDKIEIPKNQEYLFSLAKKMINQVSIYLNYELPSIEVYYVFQYLISSRVKEKEKESDDTRALKVTNQLVDFVQKKLALKLHRKVLVQDLYSHVVPMLNRLSNKISIDNALLSDILMEYQDLFHIVNDACIKVFQQLEISNPSVEEVGYLTLYFAKNLEMNPDKFRVVIICTSGMGTSELLKVKVQNSFSNIEIVDVVSRTNIKRSNLDNQKIDFILSTVNLDRKMNIPYLIVNSLFPVEDRTRVEKLMEELLQ